MIGCASPVLSGRRGCVGAHSTVTGVSPTPLRGGDDSYEPVDRYSCRCICRDVGSLASGAGIRDRLCPFADGRLRLDPSAGRCLGLERTGERMLGTAQRHADEKA